MDKFIKIFRALSDENRLRIYLLLSQTELCVCELINILDIEQSRISHSLRILREAGLIDNYRVGKWNIYSVDQRIKENSIIKALEYEIKLSKIELDNLQRCKIENIREKSKCN